MKALSNLLTQPTLFEIPLGAVVAIFVGSILIAFILSLFGATIRGIYRKVRCRKDDAYGDRVQKK